MQRYAWGYDGKNQPTRVHPGVFDAEAYGVKSSAADLVQGLGWEQYPYPIALDELVAGNSDAMAVQPNPATRLIPGPPTRPTLFDKTGSTDGFGAYLAFVPQRKIGIVMLANKNFPNSARVTAAYSVLERLSAEV